MDAIKSFFVGDYETEEEITQETNLREDLWLDEMAFEDLSCHLADSLGGARIPQHALDSCETVGDVLSEMEKHRVEEVEHSKYFAAFPMFWSERQKRGELDNSATPWFVFYHAGGIAGNYRTLCKELDAVSGDEVIVPYIVERKGRGSRADEEAADNVLDETETLALAMIQGPLRQNPSRKFVVMAHSMGSLVGFETCRELLKLGYAPSALVVCSRHAPTIPTPDKFVEGNTTEQFLEKMTAVYKNDALLKLWREAPSLVKATLPYLMADMRAFESYRFSGWRDENEAAQKLPFRIVAATGADDPRAKDEGMAKWREMTSIKNGFAFKTFAGDHFFLQGNASFHRWVLEQIRARV